MKRKIKTTAGLKTIKTVDAVGHILANDVTRIVPGEFKGRLFSKGHKIREEDVAPLLDIGKDILYVWEQQPGFVHENDAAVRLGNILKGDNLTFSEIKEGKINMISTVNGVLKIDTDLLFELNMIDEVLAITKPNLNYVEIGETVAGTRVVPLLIDEEKILKAEALITKPIISVKPIVRKKVAIVTTGNEIFYGRIEEKFRGILTPKLTRFGCEIVDQTIVPDDLDTAVKAIQKYLDEGIDLVICTGGMSVDASDITPIAIGEVCENVVSYGMPILTGSMTMVGYTKNKTPLLGLPAGVLFTDKSSLDILIHRILADDEITREDIARYGNGGLLK